MPHAATSDVDAVRAFNRLYTQRLGLLNAHLDGSPFTLSEARILYELAHRDAPTAADVMRALDLDRAQLSRTLKRFAARHLIETAEHPGGGRRRSIGLTEAGRQAFAALVGKTNNAVGDLLTALPPDKRRSLVAAARSITQIFDEGGTAGLLLREPKPGDLGWITHRQAVLYAEEHGWNADYEVLVIRILADVTRSFDPSCEAIWIAEIDGRVVGSVFLVRSDRPAVGKLRLLYVEPDTRGKGVGSALVSACIERARAIGYEALELWTNSNLTAARRIYERAGFRLTREEPHHSFGKDLVGQTWLLDLRLG
ncbi:bifunctional helix-turn-helix transcriptional regulator/GNAT family N-acetyltransferase [Mangrovicella endophytica]|uniref:bifunctional helix-turn-helix transcriptional regulator/GNAT family N-acetyltransferase n=1 Tax=Mangrovicella endophytica TaxID=2066697 RepID=UPI000C9E85FE|nr:helix-turn-helix domain-containing GNAT family N-acetyltransferase [Mangrovicella endophytica]